MVPGTEAGRTIEVTPGEHRLRWRRPDCRDRARLADHEIAIEVPPRGYLAIQLHRWPWGVPSAVGLTE